MESVLSSLLVEFPERALTELPEMFNSFDAGEAVNLSAIIDDKYRKHLELLMSHLPLSEHPIAGWHRSPDAPSVSGFILGELLDTGAIKQPKHLSNAETHAYRAIPYLQEILKEFPELINELPVLLDNILNGNVLVLDGLANHDLRHSLSILLKKLDVKQVLEQGDYVYKLNDSDDDEDGVQTESIAENALRAIRKTFTNVHKCSLYRKKNTNGDSSSSNHGDSNNSSNSNNKGKSRETERTIGPAAPSKHELAQAKKAQKEYIKAVNDGKFLVDDEDSSSDDDVGPSPLGSGNTSPNDVGSLPLGALSPTTLINSINPERYNDAGSNNKGGREEWMLTPGESKTVAEHLGQRGGAVANRKFQDGKKAKKDAQEILRKRDIQQKAFEESEEGQRIRNILKSDRDARGLSLMERHMDMKRSKKRQLNERGERVGFDRDKEIVHGKRRTDDNAAKLLVEQASQLNSMFSSRISKGI